MKAARSDANQKQIVEALRKIGCSVQSLHRCGDGVPDLLVGRNGFNLLLEVKTVHGALNARQKRWHGEWHGDGVQIVHSPETAVEIVLLATTLF